MLKALKQTIKQFLIDENVPIYGKKRILATLGGHAISADNIFIVSYPRSGNTWLRFFLANILYPEKIINLSNIDDFVLDLGAPPHPGIRQRSPQPRFLKTHYPFYNYFPKFIYIYRDGRDAMISHYFYRVQNGNFRGTFSEFLKMRLFKKELCFEHWLPWHMHVSRALDFAKKHPERALLLQYEKMIAEPHVWPFQVNKFCNLNAEKSIVERAVERTAFANLKKTEDACDAEEELKPEAKFFRSGKSGQWKTIFSKEDMALFYSVAEKVMRKLNYL